jgi:hydrogenase maturation protease
MTQKQSVLIIGIGTEFRGDDSAGLLVARALRASDFSPSVRVHEMKGDGAALMALWKDASRVILVDAITAGLPPGSAIRIDARRELAPSNLFSTSSHSFGVAQALAISLALNELPPCVTLFGIQAGTFGMGADISPEVKKAVQDTIDAIRRELATSFMAENRRQPGTPRPIDRHFAETHIEQE